MPDEPKPKLTIEWSPEPPPLHANHAAIFSGPDGFVLSFTAIIPATAPGTGERVLQARPVAAIHLSPDVFFNLVKTSVEAWQVFRSQTAPDLPPLELKSHEA